MKELPVRHLGSLDDVAYARCSSPTRRALSHGTGAPAERRLGDVVTRARRPFGRKSAKRITSLFGLPT